MLVAGSTSQVLKSVIIFLCLAEKSPAHCSSARYIRISLFLTAFDLEVFLTSTNQLVTSNKRYR